MTSESLQRNIDRQVRLVLFTLVLLGVSACKNDAVSDMDYYEKHLKGRYAVEIDAPIILKNENGKIVGRLEAGCILQSPSLDDVGDVDVSDNQRMKVVFDIPKDASWQRIEQLRVLEAERVETEP